MRRDDALLTVAGISVSAFLVMAGPSMAVAAADPGGSNGNGGNSSSGKAGSGKSGSPRANGGGNSGNGGSGSRGNSGANSSVAGQTNTGKSSRANGKGNNNAPGAQSGSGSDNPAAVPVFTPPNPAVPVVVAEQHTGTTAGSSWWPAPAAPPAVEVQAPAAPPVEGEADLLSADHTGVPVWAAAEPIGVRGDLFGLAGLVLMPLIGLVVGYRQARAARDIGQPIPR